MDWADYLRDEAAKYRQLAEAAETLARFVDLILADRRQERVWRSPETGSQNRGYRDLDRRSGNASK
jgi:hypothetical protein